MKFGAHLSISGGYYRALEKIKEIGGSCLQIFSSSPRGWFKTKIRLKEKKQFVDLKEKLSIDPVYFHANYLINLADNERIGDFSKENLIHELNLAGELGIKGTIVHLGSYKDKNSEIKRKKLILNIKEILKNTPENTLFIIENSGTKKIGQDLSEISEIIKEINSGRLRICLDTCHLYSAGYKFETKAEFDFFLEKLAKLDLINRLELWHLNDSKDHFGSGRDRHENIGQGKIGLKEFEIILNHPKMKNLPFIIETPGFDKKGPDKKNLYILKSLIYN